MVRLFGNYDVRNDWSIWQPANIPKEYAQYFEQGRGRISMQMDRTILVGSVRKRFVVFATLPDSKESHDCHMCAVLLSGMVFLEGSTEPFVRDDFLMEDGQFGSAPAIHLRRLGREHVAVEFVMDYCMGGTCAGSLFLFGEADGHLRQMLALRSDNDDSDLNICSSPGKQDVMGCESDPIYCFDKAATSDRGYRESCTSWTGSLFVLRPNQEHGWSDLVFTQHVKAARPGAFTHRQYRTHLRFKDSEYKAVEPLPHGPSIDVAYYNQH